MNVLYLSLSLDQSAVLTFFFMKQFDDKQCLKSHDAAFLGSDHRRLGP